MRLRSVLLALVAIALLVTPASAQQDTGLATVSAVSHVLLDLFYRPLDAHTLLRAGWCALHSDAVSALQRAAGNAMLTVQATDALRALFVRAKLL